MPKPVKFSYEKKAPFRDAFFFIIVCEGTNREIDYFRFFEGMSSRVQVIPVTHPEGSAPKLLVQAAIAKEEELDASADRDRVWFVIDTDRWRAQLHEIRTEAEQHPHWRVAQSNPCFEVWLYFHGLSALPPFAEKAPCPAWKTHLPTVIKGGFKSDRHPAVIETASANAKAVYSETGYLPNRGSTQLWRLAEELLPLIGKDLAALKEKFPAPELIEK